MNLAVLMIKDVMNVRREPTETDGRRMPQRQRWTLGPSSESCNLKRPRTGWTRRQ